MTVVGQRIEAPGEEFVPVHTVDEMVPSDFVLPEALALLFRDRDSPFLRIRDRSHLPPCGLMVLNQFTSADEMELDSDQDSADVRTCVWEAHQAAEGAEYVVLRDSLDAGYSTHLIRLAPGGEVDRWSLLRHFGTSRSDGPTNAARVCVSGRATTISRPSRPLGVSSKNESTRACRGSSSIRTAG